MRGPEEVGNPGRELREDPDPHSRVFREPGVRGDPGLVPSSRRDLDCSCYWQALQVSQGFPRAPKNEASRDSRTTRPNIAPGPRRGGGGNAWSEAGGSETVLSPQEGPRWPLPVKRLSLPPTKLQLSEEQAAVLRVVLKGQSIFFTGSAGCGGQSEEGREWW